MKINHLFLLIALCSLSCENNQRVEAPKNRQIVDDKKYVLVDFGFGEQKMERSDLFKTEDIDKCVLLNRLSSNRFLVFDTIELDVQEDKRLNLSDENKIAYLKTAVIDEFDLLFKLYSFRYFDFDKKNLPDSLEPYISFKGKKYLLNKLYSEDDCGFCFEITKLEKFSFCGEKFLLLFIKPLIPKEYIFSTAILFKQGVGFIKLPGVVLENQTKFRFNDFDNDKILDYIFVSPVKKEIELYSLVNDYFVKREGKKVSFTIEKSEEDEVWFIDSLNSNWFGKNGYVYGLNLIDKDTVD